MMTTTHYAKVKVAESAIYANVILSHKVIRQSSLIVIRKQDTCTNLKTNRNGQEFKDAAP